MSSETMTLMRNAGGSEVLPLQWQIEQVREKERRGLSGPKFAAMAELEY